MFPAEFYRYFSKRFRRFPWFFCLLILICVMIGIAMLYSAAQGSFTPWAQRQLIHVALFVPVMIAIAFISIRYWFAYAYHAYFFSLFLLILVEFMGYHSMGATRWLSLGGFKIQPSELMKVTLVLALARYFHNINVENIKKLGVLVPPLIMIAVPFLLILRQPDLGTGLILLMNGVIILFISGVRLWKFIVATVGALIAAPIMWQFLHGYQKKRILTFLNPETDPMGAGYNILQSKIAIGSGGVSGKGFLQGSQSQLDFLPEHQTDFIFTMFAEEFGFLGSTVFLVLFAMITLYGMFVALQAHNHFSRLMAVGCISLFFLHATINMGMVMGLLPVVGAPLPLISYGGTIMATMLINFGLIMNVAIHGHVAFRKGL